MSKVTLVTGASSGIGEALAYRLAKEGHTLVLAARRKPELDRVAAEAKAKGAKGVLAVEADVTRRADVERVAAEAVKAFGRFDVFVNNAGRGISRPVLELTDADVDEMMTVNLKSALYGMQVAAKHFVARGDGQLVNVSSFLGRVPMANIRSAYSAAKAALNSLTANLRTDLAATHPGIKVTLVMPGMVATEFAKNALGASPAFRPPPGAMQAQSAEEVAEVIASVIAKPVAEVYTNPASAELARRYYADVGAFEAALRR